MDSPWEGAGTTSAPTALPAGRADGAAGDFDAATVALEVLFASPLAIVIVPGEEPLVLTSPLGGETPTAVASLALRVQHGRMTEERTPAGFASTGAHATGVTHVGRAIAAGRSHVSDLHDEDGTVLGTLAIVDLADGGPFEAEAARAIADVSLLVADRLQSRCREVRRAATEARFRNIAATSPDAIMCADGEGRTTFWNAAAEQLFGYSAAEMLGSPLERIIPQEQRAEFFRDFERLSAALGGAAPDHRVRAEGQRRDGTRIPVELSLSSWWEGSEMAVGAIVRDLTAQLDVERRLYRLATTDSLTGLKSRGSLHEALERHVSRREPVTFIMLDLDGFKEVNDTLGHTVGDELLTMVATRLKASMEGASCVGRLGGDEFAVLVEGDDAARAIDLGDTLIRAVSGQYVAKRQRVDIGVSVGIAAYPQDAQSAEMLVSAADLALYSAKGRGRGHVCVYEPALRKGAIEQHTLRQELRTAYHEGQFELVYQPQWARGGATLVGAEALMRWNHPTRGQLSPAHFIDTLARKPIAPAVGEWVIRTACEQAARWREEIPDFHIAVNLFESQLRSDTLVESVERILADTGLPGSALELELVETILTRDDDETARALAGLRDLGVSLAFDDYGTGFASLSLLKRYPVSRLKIDRTFVRGVDADDENAAVVNAVLYLASIFGLEVVAEGIETEAELAFLRGTSCAFYQGYLLGRPMPVAAFEETCLSPAATD
ncbi:bifunctional diguanylate cyclase/phosphodiesterase [Demequina sp. NBRC 110055]|uniref:putative bifunctional diguanylate cyclase/phosphodiesterase n=1 Tax=Demequina sp. NBRC 110055 TaxID=1570344 RepID=UPI001356477F|nr:EAL domain-containing protein [Demequina sp. NBRC 110055]